MRAYIVEVVIVDHDELGEAEIRAVIESTRYPNHCIDPQVVKATAYEIGEWDDRHPLNLVNTDAVAWLRDNAKVVP